MTSALTFLPTFFVSDSTLRPVDFADVQTSLALLFIFIASISALDGLIQPLLAVGLAYRRNGVTPSGLGSFYSDAGGRNTCRLYS